MASLIILDIADNTISGHILSCLGNIRSLVFNNNSHHKLFFFFPSFDDHYFSQDDTLELVTKGQVLEYDKKIALYDREIGQHNNKLYNRVIDNENKFPQTCKNL